MRSVITNIIFFLTFSCSREKNEQYAAEKMQQFVSNISNYAKSLKSDFIIIPQNGIELTFYNTNPDNGINTTYLNAIDGLAVEELFYNGTFSPDSHRISMLQQIKSTKKILVSEYVSNNNDIADAFTKNYNEGFICFVRNDTNYHYKQIPDTIPNENSNDITNISQAQNFFYLLNSENYSSKQEFINAISATNFDLILIDLFFQDQPFTPSEINQLKTKANGGKRLVLSYINIGAAETFRYYWNSHWTLHNPSWLKKKYQGYDDEYWVEFWNKDWQNIIYGNDNSYLKKIIDAGFDGAFLDNVESYYFLYNN
ncbi:MAG: endo alpha-1,4 polygalactosaminidase [Bacteroidia bacterium]